MTTPLGAIRTIVNHGLLAEAICVGYGEGEDVLFIEQIDSYTSSDDIVIHHVPPTNIFANNEAGRTKAIEKWQEGKL